MKRKKYEFTGETMEQDGAVLRRIRATRSFNDVEKGEIGGWIESEANLSHYGTCWVYDKAKVWGKAMVCDNADVFGNSEVFGKAHVRGFAQVFGEAKVFGHAEIYGFSDVCVHAIVAGKASVHGYAHVHGYAQVYGHAIVFGYAQVYGHARVFGYAEVCGNAEIAGNAKVGSNGDYTVFKNFWSSYRWFTYTRSNKMWKVGCFYGTGQELKRKSMEDGIGKFMFYSAHVDMIEGLERATE